MDAAEEETESVDSRERMFASAWQQFLEKPILGSALLEETSGFYPHNLVLEAFMATGIIGGCAYLLLIALMLNASIRLLIKADGYEWLALLAIMYLVGAQFSGSHWGFNAHWQSLVLVIVTERATNRGGVNAADTNVTQPVRRRRRKKVYA